ncbi:hypothetical protein PWT90_08270 [Aphanocladium album]|nr:hypothetical protein PWT90_08270 [Aphanocladium album]
MEIILETPSPSFLGHITATLASWQSDIVANHIHPGDLGWFERFGTGKAAASVRIWSSAADKTILAIGLLDGADLLRATVAPSARRNKALARAMAADITDPERGVLPRGSVSVDISADALVREHVAAADGWAEGEQWTWLRADLGGAEAPPPPSSSSAVGTANLLRAETAQTAEQIRQRVDVLVKAFEGSTFTVDKWHAMAASPAYKETGAKCLVLYEGDEAVGAATVWSAGPGRPGMLEPVGVSAKHHGRGLGTALCRAAVEELRRMGASSAVVGTPSSNVSAVAAYKKAGFVMTRLHNDLYREG